ncbi:hypothetical protein GCM10023331_07920 [Algivirga pacifica]|uniref:TonB C-terminal domain-containing protein n=1 Tax=Algivirga pacifica TaxID=1162670 RepID=A0ABP9D3K0_9BACT
MGEIVNVRVINNSGRIKRKSQVTAFNRELIRVVESMPNWISPKCNGVLVAIEEKIQL